MIYSPPGVKVLKFGFCARRWLCVRSPVLGDGAGGYFFATLYISSLSPVLSRFNCVMDNLPYSPSKTPVLLFIYLLLDSVVYPLRLVW